MIKKLLLFHLLFVLFMIFFLILTIRCNSIINYNVDHISEENIHIKFHQRDIIFLIIFTSNIYEQVMNFYITSIKKFNITNTVFLSLDTAGYYMIKNQIPNVYMSSVNHNISQHIDYNTPLYWKIVYSKTIYVKSFIDKKYDVILCDTDVIFFKDPRKYMLEYNTDLVTTCDHKCPIMNSGL